MSSFPRPAADECAPYYVRYIEQVPDGDIVATLRDTGRTVLDELAAIPESRGGHRYAEGKWSLREVVGHLIDAERVFAYRALRIARGDATPLASFDENVYVQGAGSEARTMADLVEELRVVREGTVRMLAALPRDAWSRAGTASDQRVTVRALAFIMAGHALHHARIVRERYAAA